jgi:hypothetical protein
MSVGLAYSMDESLHSANEILLSPASKKIIRGGCYCSWPNKGRSAERNYQLPETCGNSIGFLICISPQPNIMP